MPKVVLSLILVLLPGVAQAALFICGDASTFRGHTFADPSLPPTSCPAPSALSKVSEANTEAQLALINAFAAQRYYLKVVGTAPDALVTEKTQGEKDAADAAIQAKLDEQAAYEEAATNNDLCHATLDELATAKAALDSNLTGDIAAISNIATAKTELQDMMTRLTNALEKLMRCIRGRAGPPVTP